MISYLYKNARQFFFIIYIAFLIFSLITDNSNLIINSESYIEFVQVLLLLFNILLLIKKKKLIKKVFGKSSLIFRIFITSFLIFEELSWLSKNICNFCSSFNLNGELNFHNSVFFEDPSFSLINAPIIGPVANNTLLISLILVLLSIGNFLPFKNKFLNSIFLDKKLYYFGFIFIFDRLIYWIFIILNIIQRDKILLMHNELLELFIYILFTFDLIIKIKFKKL